MPIVIAPDTTVTVEPPVPPVIRVSVLPSPAVSVEPPSTPITSVAAPPDPTVTVVPVVGPPGPRGPAGVSTNASCVWPVPTPTYLVQVIHDLGFYPAGVTVVDQSGYPVEYAGIAYPSIDIAEVSFDVLFTGTIYLS